MEDEVIACVSGNLANIYFNLHAGKISQGELEEAHPGLLDALIHHEGIGLVVCHDDHGQPWALGKAGARHLRTGQIVKQDPLRPYGDSDFRAGQLLRLSEFPHAGDLVLISTFYPDGQVAAFEELVGCHGGLGGQQTDAFLFHPADMEIRPTSNATDIYHLLNARREVIGPPLEPQTTEAAGDDWSRANLLAGMRDTERLLARAGRVFRLERSVFQEVAGAPQATGQALLILLILAIATGIAGVVDPDQPGPPMLRFAAEVISSLIGWAVLVLFSLVAGRTLKGRGSFSRNFRAIAFAQIPAVVTWLRIVPQVGALFNLAGSLMVLVASWLALQEALHLSKWRALLIPIAALLVIALSLAVIGLVSSGATLTLETILEQLSLAGQ
jgi:hypothetical protein